MFAFFFGINSENNLVMIGILSFYEEFVYFAAKLFVIFGPHEPNRVKIRMIRRKAKNDMTCSLQFFNGVNFSS